MVLPNNWTAQSIYSMTGPDYSVTGPDYSVDRATQLNLYKLYEKRTYVIGIIDHLFKTDGKMVLYV